MNPYEVVASVLLSSCPAEHEEVRLQAELDDGWAAIDVRCVGEDGVETLVAVEDYASHQMHVSLDRIREEMAVQSGKKWKSCIFTVKDGRFNMKVSYAE